MQTYWNMVSVFLYGNIPELNWIIFIYKIISDTGIDLFNIVLL